MSNNDERHTGPARGAYDEAQKLIRERNEDARRTARKERDESDRRLAVEQSRRDAANGVYR